MTKKYRKGATINSVTLLAMEIDAGSWIYYKGRPLHPGFILHMNLATVLGGLRAGNFAIAKESKNSEEVNGEHRQGYRNQTPMAKGQLPTTAS